MSACHRDVFSKSLSLVRPTLVLRQIALALLVAALSALWLRLPDFSALWLGFTVVLGIAVVIVAGVGESSLLLWLAIQPRTRRRLLLGTALLFTATILWYFSGSLIDHFSANDGLRAGYWNARFGQGARYFFTFEHFIVWQGWFWSLLLCVLRGLLVAFLVAPIAAVNAVRGITSTLRSVPYWLGVVIFFYVAPVLANALEVWVPGHGLMAEFMSFVLRLLVAVLIYVIAACFLLAVIAVCARRANGDYIESGPGGTPLESQTRTVDTP